VIDKIIKIVVAGNAVFLKAFPPGFQYLRVLVANGRQLHFVCSRRKAVAHHGAAPPAAKHA
jgi:hypothetical protein